MAEPDAPTAISAMPRTAKAKSDFDPGEAAAIKAQLKLPVTTPNVQGEDPVAAAPAGTTIDKLLTPTQDVPGDAYVHFGNVKVERALVGDWKAAQQYLAAAPEAVNVLNALEKGSSEITIHQISNGDDLFDPSTTTIDWDPHSALLAPSGSTQTPAMALLHEQGHASEFLRDPTRQQNNANDGNQRFDNAEEQRNIQGLETRVAVALGEGTRSDHGGISFVVKDPANRTPSGPVQTDTNALLNAIHGDRFVLTLHGYPNVPPPPTPDASGVAPWDKAEHTGSVIHIDGNTVAQYVGGSKYAIYDVQKDLHGVIPPENTPGVTISTQGIVHSPPQPDRGQTVAPGATHEATHVTR